MSKDRIAPRTLAAYFERELPPAETSQLERQIAASPEAQRRLERYAAIADVLSAPEPELEGFDLAGAVRRAVAAPAARPRTRRARFVVGSLALSAAASLLLFVAVGRKGGAPSDEGFQARGAAAPVAGRWAGVRLYRVRGDDPPAALGTTIGRRDGVLVSYSNLGPKPYAYLTVFAVDARGQVAWLYPAWERAADDPSSIAIEKGAASELRALIHPAWAPGPATLYALFSREPWHVRQIEALLARGRGPLPISDAAEERFSLTVEP